MGALPKWGSIKSITRIWDTQCKVPSYSYAPILTLKSGAQYATLPKCSSHPSLVIYFFFVPITPIKLKVRLLRATHLDQSRANVRFCFAFLPASSSRGKMLGQNHCAEPNWHVLTFFHPIFFLHGYLSSTVKLFLASGFFSILCSSSVFLFFCFFPL